MCFSGSGPTHFFRRALEPPTFWDELFITASFQATVVAKLAYASPAWWGFASAADKARIEAFLRRSVHFGYRADSAPTFASICAAADDKLFALIKSNSRHLLYPLLPLHVIIITNYGIVPATIFNFLSAPQLFVTLIFYEDIV
jgi:hypothetical protein